MKQTRIRLYQSTISEQELNSVKAALNTHSTAKVINYLCTIGIAAYKATIKHSLL